MELFFFFLESGLYFYLFFSQIVGGENSTLTVSLLHAFPFCQLSGVVTESL